MREIRILGEVVRRPAGPAAPAIHALLNHLERAGLPGVPRALGFDADGCETLTLVAGDVYDDPMPAFLWSEQTLTDAARLLRRLHDATVGFEPPAGAGWDTTVSSPPDLATEVISHNDFAPYNAVFRGETLVGVIDFDVASPGARVWDIALTVYRWVPLSRNLAPPELLAREVQVRRLRLFCDAYGLDTPTLADVVVRRVAALRDRILMLAAAGDEVSREHLARGDAALYDDDVSYLSSP